MYTSLGWVGAAVSEQGIARIILPEQNRSTVARALSSADCREKSAKAPRTSDSIGIKAAALLRRYFSGERVSFDLPLDLRYYTAFQKAVWKATSAIPWGETRSYAWVAKRTGRPKAVRAVGQALGANPVPVIIP